MFVRQHWRTLFSHCLVAAGLVAAHGCLCYLHSLPPPTHPCSAPCAGIPKSACDKVYIVLVYGADPLDCANLSGVREYIHSLGFGKVYSGSPVRTAWFAEELHRVHHRDPDAHFVLIGHGIGAGKAEELANILAADGIVFDTLICLSGSGLDGKQPENVLRVVSIHGGTKGTQGLPEQAEEQQIEHAGHFGTPTHPQTLHLIAEELHAVAAKVPFVAPHDAPPLPQTEPTPHSISPGETAPKPRLLPPQPIEEPDEWDFLKPVLRLEPLAESELVQPPKPAVRTPSLSAPVADEPARPTADQMVHRTRKTPAPGSPSAPTTGKR